MNIIVANIWAGNSFIPLKTVPIEIHFHDGNDISSISSLKPKTLIQLVFHRDPVHHSQIVRVVDVWNVVHAEYGRVFKEQCEYMMRTVLDGSIDALELTTVENDHLKAEVKNVELEASTKSLNFIDMTKVPNTIHPSAITTYRSLLDYAGAVSNEFLTVIDQYNDLGRRIFKRLNYVS